MESLEFCYETHTCNYSTIVNIHKAGDE